MTEPINPADVENAILAIVNEIAKQVRVIHDAEERSRVKTREYDLAYARAYMLAEGSIPAKKYTAVIETEQQRIDMDAEQLAFAQAKRDAEALNIRLMGWQSIGNSVRSMYSAAAY